jgi:hypothetical protein
VITGLSFRQSQALLAALASLSDPSWTESLIAQTNAALLATGAAPWFNATLDSVLRNVFAPWSAV